MTTPSKRRRLEISKNWGPESVNRIVYECQGKKCCYCGCSMIIPLRNHKFNIQVQQTHHNLATREHIRKLADGGKNAKHNIAIACSRCNSQRGDMNWLEYCTLKRGEHETINSKAAG